MQWALLPPLLSSLFPIHNVFNVVRRQDLDVIGTLIGMLGYFIALTFLFKDGAAVSNFPQAMLIGRGDSFDRLLSPPDSLDSPSQTEVAGALR